LKNLNNLWPSINVNMKSRVVLSLSIVISLLASLAIISVGTAFALSESDITVQGNGDTWVTHDNGVNQIDTNAVIIRIQTDVGVSDIRCQLKSVDGGIVHEFDTCKSSDINTEGHVAYDNLDGVYTFTVEITSNFNDNVLVLAYDFTTQGSPSVTSAKPGVSAGENITGSINITSAITKAIASQMKTSLSDASSAAEKSIGNNSHAVAAHVGDENGYLIYDLEVVDSNGKVHKVIIDPMNGKILLSRELSGFGALMMFHQGMPNGHHDLSMMNPDFNYGHQMMMRPGSDIGR
jgi:uncharacterized membrane protein YkoI